MRNTVPLLIDSNVSTYDKLRLILLYVIQRGGISEENLAKLIQHAQIPEPQAAVVRNLAALGVPILLEAGSGPVSRKLFICIFILSESTKTWKC